MSGAGRHGARPGASAPVAWVTGASGAWGGAIARELLARGHDVVALGRHDVPELTVEAARLGRCWGFVMLDLGATIPAVDKIAALAPEGLRAVPEVLVHAAVSIEGDRAALVAANYLGPAALVEKVATAMTAAGRGRIGVLLGQNGRLGLAGLGDFSAAQGALWTWLEACRDDLRRRGSPVTLTLVIPPRTASRTQWFVAQRSGHRARLGSPAAESLVRAVLAGRPRAGRRPVLAALRMLA